MHYKKGEKLIRFILLVWMILNLSILPFASAYSDDSPKISFTRKVSSLDINGTFGKITAISSNKPSPHPKQSLKPSTYNSVLLQNSKITLQKSKSFILTQPSLFIMVTWSLFITLLTCFIYFKHSKKSQLTMFFLLGIVMISIFFFVFYLKRSVTETKLKKEVKKISTDVLETLAIKNYVQICLDDSVKEALTLAGIQGGNIYENTNAFGINLTGVATDWVNRPNAIGKKGIGINYSNYTVNLRYAIFKPVLDNTQSKHPDVPRYPYEDSLSENPIDSSDNATLINTLGNFLPTYSERVSSLPFLCSMEGSNYWNVSDVEFSCEPGTYDAANPNSMQEYIEKYVTNKMKECVDFSVLLVDTGYDVSQGNVTTEVLFGETNVFTTIEYPITLTVAGEAPITQFLLFTSDQKIRLKQIYELAYHMIKKDVRSIFFYMQKDADTLNDCPLYDPINKSRTNNSAPCLKPGMNVTKLEDSCSICTTLGNYSDVIMITDNVSIVNGKPFVFLFAIENRIPVLDYIDESINSTSHYSQYLSSMYGKTISGFYNKTGPENEPRPDNYNIVVDVGQFIEIIPLGIDPDDENDPSENSFMRSSYTYSGWKTPDSIYKIDGSEYKNPVTNETGVTVRGGVINAINEWNKSYYYLSGYENYTFGEIPQNKDTMVVASPSDVGYHWVRVSITDNEGKTDYQDIKIHVRCIDTDSTGVSDCCEGNEPSTPGGMDYHYSLSGTACDVACHSCNGMGGCEYDGSRSALDCLPCQVCSPSGCIDVAESTTTDRCNALHPGNGVCCGGICNDANPTIPPGDSRCYNVPSCDTGSYSYTPKGTNTDCGLCVKCDGAGNCDNDAPYNGFTDTIGPETCTGTNHCAAGACIPN